MELTLQQEILDRLGIWRNIMVGLEYKVVSRGSTSSSNVGNLLEVQSILAESGNEFNLTLSYEYSSKTLKITSSVTKNVINESEDLYTKNIYRGISNSMDEFLKAVYGSPDSLIHGVKMSENELYLYTDIINIEDWYDVLEIVNTTK
jgi:hypothetical protein